MSFVRKLTNWGTDVLNEKSKGRLRVSGRAFSPRVWGEVCPSSVLSRPSPRVFGIRETLVSSCLGEGTAPSVAGLWALQSWGGTTRLPFQLLLQTAGWRPLTTWPQECFELTLALVTGWSRPSALGGPFVPSLRNPFSVSMFPVRAPGSCTPRFGQVSWSRRGSCSAHLLWEWLLRGFRACGAMTLKPN